MVVLMAVSTPPAPWPPGSEFTLWCPLLQREATVRALPYREGPWQLVQCEATGFVFLPNPPGLEFLRDEGAWEKAYYAERDRRAEQQPVWQRLERAWRAVRNRLRKQRRFVRLAGARVRRGDVVVDVGCGWGRELEALAVAQGVVPVGIELSPGLAQQAQALLAPYGGRVVEAPALAGLEALEAGSAHLVLMCSFLEHEPQPVEVLDQVRRVLRPGGVALVQVPNFGGWNRRVRGPRWCGFRYPDHVNYFTPTTLAFAAARAGLRVRPGSWLDRNPTDDNFRAVLQAE